jgi:hypothetical protein
MISFSFLPGTGRGASEAGGGGVPQTLRLPRAPSTAFGGPPPRAGKECA